jgi:NAD(P)-dependent dehydrogenase (short-subunit alcohol dehydrogenase family)
MGMSTARRLGQTHRIVLASLSAGKMAAREAALHEDGIDAVGVTCDVTDAASVAKLADFVAARGPLRTLAHVAALSPSMGDWRTVLSVDLIGVAHMERAMLEIIQPGGAAIFVSSIAGHRAALTAEVIALLDDPLRAGFFERLEAEVKDEASSMLAYSLSKFAVNRMCRRRAGDWGAKGARIVSVSPGLIATPMGALEIDKQPDIVLNLLRATPLAREGTMMETADAIEFLASGRASFITGCDLLVDGGLIAAMESRS